MCPSFKVIDEIYLYSLRGKRLKRLAPDHVGAAFITGRRTESDLFVTMTGFTTPGIIARYDFGQRDEEKRWSIYQTTSVSGLDPTNFIAEQVGFMVPVNFL
jgi:prolyl oligopeptidase